MLTHADRAFETRSRRGAIYYGSVLIALLYVGICVIWQNHGYEREIAVAGAVRTSVQAGALPAAGTMPYCDTGGGAAPSGFAPQLPCVYPDMSELSSSTPGTNGALLVGTRMSSSVQQRNGACGDPPRYPCDPWAETLRPKESYYVGAIEDCSIMIWHAIAATVQREYAGWNGNFYIADTAFPERPAAPTGLSAATPSCRGTSWRSSCLLIRSCSGSGAILR